jgi:putative hydrolase of the HAD superfamily
MPPAFLFDLDQTLIDRTRSLLEFLPSQLRRFGADEEFDCDAYVRRFLELDANGYGDKRLAYQALRAELDLRADANELLEDFRANCFRSAHLFPGARRVLSELRSVGARMAIVSNGSSGSQMAKIEATGIAEYFDGIIISGDLGFAKPDPRIFRLAAETVGATLSECVFVGDNPERDVAGAGLLGMRTIWLAHGISWPVGVRPGPSITVQALTELLPAYYRLTAPNAW